MGTVTAEHLLWRLRNNDTAKHLCGLAADEIERLRDALRNLTARLEDEDAAYFVIQDWPEFISARAALEDGT